MIRLLKVSKYILQKPIFSGLNAVMFKISPWEMLLLS